MGAAWGRGDGFVVIKGRKEEGGREGVIETREEEGGRVGVTVRISQQCCTVLILVSYTFPISTTSSLPHFYHFILSILFHRICSTFVH